MKAFSWIAVIVGCCVTARADEPISFLEAVPSVESLPSELFETRPSPRRTAVRPTVEGGLSEIQLDAVRRPTNVGMTPPTNEPVPQSELPSRQVNFALAWEPPNQRHLPVYFEDVALERYGQTRSRVLQPAISGVKFLTHAAFLPYQMGFDSPSRLSYDVGLVRPGTAAPAVREHWPLSARGAIYQGGAATGVYFFVHP